MPAELLLCCLHLQGSDPTQANSIPQGLMSVLVPDLLETALKHLHCSGQISLPCPWQGLGTEGTVVGTPGDHSDAETGRSAVVAPGQPTRLYLQKCSADMRTRMTMVRGWLQVAAETSSLHLREGGDTGDK